jgi:hypothetical protein
MQTFLISCILLSVSHDAFSLAKRIPELASLVGGGPETVARCGDVLELFSAHPWPLLP